ncbi:MAG: hypothetical protein AAB686_03220 [Patescibacteria group bacterium]
MNLIQLIRKLKSIEPDPAYTRRSRSLIVETPMTVRPIMNLWQVVVRGLQFGSAIALTGVLLILVLGGFSVWKALSPFQLTSLDPASLKAEAEAVDAQIQITEIVYPETLLKSVSELAAGLLPQKTTEEKAAGKAAAVDTPQPMTIDEVLGKLAE